MNFKDLLDRYKKGIASEEEKKLVEQELEKYEAIENYLTESLDVEFLGREELTSIDVDLKETTQLKKSVNKRLRKVIFISVAMVVLLYFVIFYVISGIVDLVYYNPIATTQSEDKAYPFPDFYYDMQAYVSLNMPGYSFLTSIVHEQNGFGKYELRYFLRNLFTNDETSYSINLSRGRAYSGMDGIYSNNNLFWLWQGFEKIQHPLSLNTDEKDTENTSSNVTNLRDEVMKQQNDETLRYLNELNPLSYISMSIVFHDDLDMEEFYKLNKDYPSLNFKWVGIRTVAPGTRWSDNQPMHLIGFNPNFNDEASSYNRPDSDKYPFFYLGYSEILNGSYLSEEEFTKAHIKAYEKHFYSRLKYLADRNEFVEIFDYNYYKTDFYKQALAYIDEHGVNSYGVLVYGTAGDFLEQLDGIPYESLYINEILAARPNIYYTK